MTNARNGLQLVFLLFLLSCAWTPERAAVRDPIPRPSLESEAPLSVTEYGPAAPLLGIWEIEGPITLALEPAGSFRLSNFFLGGDPDPRHWYQGGYWYLRSGVLILERTAILNAEAIPVDVNRPTLTISLPEDLRTSSGNLPAFGGKAMKKVEEANRFEIQNYRSARQKSLTNPVDRLLPEQTVADSLKRNADLWGEWEIHDKAFLKLDAGGRFIAFDPSPNSRKKIGWGAAGSWHLESDSLILEMEHRSFAEHMPSYFTGKQVRLVLVRDSQSGEMGLNVESQRFGKRTLPP